MPTLQELERPIDEAIVDGLVEAIPEWWKSAVLEIEWHPKENAVEGFKHKITSPEGYCDLITLRDQLYENTFRLADLFRRHGKQWRKVIYSVNRGAKGDWKYSAVFTY